MVLMKIGDSWDMTSYRLVNTSLRFGGACCLHNQGNPRREDNPEEGNSRPLREVGTHIQTRESSFLRKLASSTLIIK
jgi:hypothetical protein